MGDGKNRRQGLLTPIYLNRPFGTLFFMATTKDIVLDAAVRLLVREGTGSLTLERVAREAAVSKGGLLYHYAGKEELVRGLVELAIANLRGEIRLQGREIGAILVAAMATAPEILNPLRAEFQRRPPTPQHLVEEGIWLREALNLTAPSVPGTAVALETIALPVEIGGEIPDLSATIARATDSLLALQKPEGYWQGDLVADTTLESDYVLLTYWLGHEQPWEPTKLPRIQKAVGTILDRRMPGGGWNIYPGGPAEVNATIRAYVALKITGHLEDLSGVVRVILELGGLQAANSYTKINLSFLGLFPRQFAPTVPPEILLVPGNLVYEMSSWTRTIIVPLSIVQAMGGERPAPSGFQIDELYVPGRKLSPPKRDKVSTVFNQVDRFLKLWERRGIKEVRAKAVREAEKWMVDHMRHSDGIGAIYPSIMYALMAMDVLGYERDHPDYVETARQFEGLILETDDRLEFQPSMSPVWDTAISMYALGEAGEANRKGADWLLEREIRRKGDWSVKRPNLQPGGWAFEFLNDYYPDIDDTAMVLLALERAKATDPVRQGKAERRAIDWLLGMQSSDGGWAAFDVDNNWQVLSKVPFADHNAMLDPTCPDITGRVLEALCARGMSQDHPAIAKAVYYLLNHQRADGSWYGRWGVNYVYGTFLAVRGLRASGAREAKGAIQRAAAWLVSVRNPDGGWGESCLSYVEHKFVREASTPSQTAWALLGLEAAGSRGTAVNRGLQWLVDRQNAAGGWDEELMTGTGFPNVFYLSYRLYSHYFPLFALNTWRGVGAKGKELA